MLKSLFTSSVRVKLLKHFFLHPNDEFFVRQITRYLNEQVNAIRRELDNWKKIWLLKSSMRAWKKYYTLNSDFIFYPELSSMIIKSFVAWTDIKKDLSGFWEIEYLYLSWVFVNKIAPVVDMFIVWEIDPNKVQEYLLNNLWQIKDIKFSVLSKKDFNYRLDVNDSMLLSIVRDKNAVVLVNKLKKKLEKYI